MAAAAEEHLSYTFRGFTLDLARGALTQGGEDVKLRPQSFRTLRYLVEHHGKLISKDELIDAVWTDTIVTADSLTQCVVDIRRALGDSEKQMVRTVPRRGFIFDVEVTRNGVGPQPRSRLSELESEASIAVLPFVNMSPDPEQEFFCEGMAEELINAMSRISGLNVAGRASAFLFRNRATDPRQIGHALNVNRVLEGSVRVSGPQLRVTIHLVDVETGYEVWTQRYDRELQDVFEIQDEIAASVVESLRSQLVDAARPLRERHQTVDLEAYQLYLKGQHFWYQRDKESLGKAAAFFEEAAAKDPSYVLAHVGIANAYTSLALYGTRFALAAPKAKGALAKARALDDQRAEVRAAKGLIHHWLDGEPECAESEFARALERRPDLVMARCWYSFLLSDCGRHDESIEVVRDTLELDPLSPYTRMSYALAYLKARCVRESVVEFEKALELDDRFLSTLWMLGCAYVLAGREEDAVAIFERAVALSKRSPAILGMLAWACACANGREEADAIIDELRLRMQDEYVAPVYLAWSLAVLGERDTAFNWIERSIAEKDVSIRMLFQYPFFDCLRSDPRLEDAADRYGWVARFAPK